MQLKVTQRKSTIGCKRSQRETVRTLGLRRINDVVIMPDRPEIRGMVHAVRHLVTVEMVADSGGGRVNSVATHVSDRVGRMPKLAAAVAKKHAPAVEGVDMNRLREDFESSPDGVRVFSRGEFVEWHKFEEGRTLLWSSALRLPTLLEIAAVTIGSADEAHRGVVDLNEVPGEVTTALSARETAFAHADDVTFLRLEFKSGVVLVWTPRSVSDELAQQSKFSETSLYFTKGTVGVAASTMGRTATKMLVSLADTITRSVAA